MWLLLFIVLLVPIFFVRWLRWLGILQQKEYRFDRLFAFFQSDEGKAELGRAIPLRSDFSRKGMKRPRTTARALLVACMSLVILVLEVTLATWGAMYSQPYGSVDLVFGITLLLLIYLFIPVTVVLGAVPSMAVAAGMTLLKLRGAQRALQKGNPKIIGIGGSYGKTSTKHLLHHFLSQKYSVFVTPKSFNTKLSVAQSILSGYKKQKIALLEYGAYIRGEIEYLAKWFPPDMAVETGFTPQHLSLFGTRENSILAESELIAALHSDGVAFCNGADPGAVEICQTGAQRNQVTIKMYSGKDSEIHFENPTVNVHGQLQVTWKGKRLHTKLIGRQYQVNLQAAVLVSEELGLTTEEIVDAARTFTPNSSFIEGKLLKNGSYLIDDGGTSNPMGFAAGLELLAELPYQNKVLVTAGMIDLGNESRQIHFKLAKRAKELGLTVIHVGPDGKDEFNEVFESELITQIERAQQLIQESDKQTVILLEGKVPRGLEDSIQQSILKNI